jgi:hypothetical protein
MLVPLFTADQYIDADSLNAAAADASGAIGIAMAGTLYPGLIYADSASFVVSGLSVTSTLTLPFGVLFSTGILSQAHGTVNGADTQSYVTNLSGLVPGGSGSITAFLVAAYQQIQQNSLAITGPPPGHPDFNPNFVPYTAYGTLADSLALSATSGTPDNAATFELCRFTLTSASINLPAPNLTFQVRNAGIRNIQTVTPAVSATLSSSRHQQIPVAEIYLLPAVSGVNGVTRTISARGSGFTSVLSASGDAIYGCYPTPSFAAGGLFLLQGQACQLLAANGVWQVIAGSPWISMYRQLLTGQLDVYFSTTGSNTNTGLSAASPFADPQFAMNFVNNNFDLGNQAVLIHGALGNYTTPVSHSTPWVGGGNVTLSFAAGSTVSVVSGSCFTASGPNTGYKITTEGAGAPVLCSATGTNAGQGCVVYADSSTDILPLILTYGTCGVAHVQILSASRVLFTNSYAVCGGAQAHISYTEGGRAQYGGPPSSIGVTVYGTPNFSQAFLLGSDSGSNAQISGASVSFSGAATGIKFLINTNASCQTNGAGVNFLPGSIGGSGITGGIYA